MFEDNGLTHIHTYDELEIIYLAKGLKNKVQIMLLSISDVDGK